MTARDWAEILTTWGAVVFFALMFLYIRSLRVRAVNQAGQMLLRVLRPRVRRWCVYWFALSCVVLVPQWALLLTGTVRAVELARTVVYTMLPLLALLLNSMSLGDMYIEVRENGIVLRAEFWPWEKVRSYAWLDRSYRLDVGSTLRLRLAGYGMADYRIAASQKDALDRLLQEKLSAADKTEPALPSSGTPS